MRPLRVVHVVESLGLGGLERVVQSLCAGRSGRFAPEVLVLAGEGRLAAEIEASGVAVRRLGLKDYYPTSILRAARALFARRAELVHTHGHFAGIAGRLAARFAGVRFVVHHLHTVDTTLRPRHRRLERLLGRLTARVLCCSEAVAMHARVDLALPQERIEVVRNGIEPAPVVDRDEARRLLGSPHPPIVGMVGALRPHKGQAVLLRAFAALPIDLRGGTLVLVGEGPDRGALEETARSLGIRERVVLLGERRDARRLLPALDLLAAPSIGREGLGLAALEAMDAGLPVVASRTGGLEEVVEEGRTGLLVPEGNPAALAEAIASILGRPDRGAALGAEGRRRVERSFRAGAMVRRVEAIYEGVLDVRRRAA